MAKLKHIVNRLRDALCQLDMSAKYLSDIWTSAESITVNVIGDPILDRYVDVECGGQAKGYPVLKWNQVAVRDYAGGCLKVAKDCAAQCERVHLGLCGEGLAVASAMMALSEASNIAFYGRGSPSCSLVEKIRYCYHNHQLFRLTIEHGDYGVYPSILDAAHVTILSIFDREEPIGGAALKHLMGSSLLCVDSQNPKSIRQYRSDQVILFATEDEFAASGCVMPDFRAVFLKNGIHGSVIHGTPIPALNEEPVDDIGAGDAYLATAAIVLGTNRDNQIEAALLGSIAAALHCAEWGNITITRGMIEDVLAQAS